MEKSNLEKTSRRDFITKIAPACSLICFSSMGISAKISSLDKSLLSQEKHKFEQDFTFGRTMTFKEYYNRRFNNKFIPILQEMADIIGRKQFLEILKKAGYEDNRKRGERVAKRIPQNDLSFFARAFVNPGVDFQHSMTYEIIENTDKAFEVKITECLTEVTFREANASDIGFAGVCYADYGYPEGLNPKLKLVRDKTLMEGHDCCNHRYMWK